MDTIRVIHKDGDNTAISMIYYFSIFLKEHRTLWNSSEDVFLNRFYKGVLTKTIKKCDALIEKYKSRINYKNFVKVKEIVTDEFERLGYTETGIDYELLKSAFCGIMIFNCFKKNKKEVIGVTLRMFLKDVENAFERYYKMWIRDVDEILAEED